MLLMDRHNLSIMHLFYTVCAKNMYICMYEIQSVSFLAGGFIVKLGFAHVSEAV
jgi:hypothetical protein